MAARLRELIRPASKLDLSAAFHNAPQNSHPQRPRRYPRRLRVYHPFPDSVICILIGHILRKSFPVRSVDGCVYISISAAAAARCFYMHHRWAWRLPVVPCEAEFITIIGIWLFHIFFSSRPRLILSAYSVYVLLPLPLSLYFACDGMTLSR